eukprot:g23597.t1
MGSHDFESAFRCSFGDSEDLNKNDLLEEAELIKLNQKIAMLHYGKGSKDADHEKVEEKYRNHFREHLDAEGKPVAFARFKEYMVKMLNSIDPDPRAQEMMLEQWIAEAESGRAAFFCNSMSSQPGRPRFRRKDGWLMLLVEHEEVDLILSR